MTSTLPQAIQDQLNGYDESEKSNNQVANMNKQSTTVNANDKSRSLDSISKKNQLAACNRKEEFGDEVVVLNKEAAIIYANHINDKSRSLESISKKNQFIETVLSHHINFFNEIIYNKIREVTSDLPRFDTIIDRNDMQIDYLTVEGELLFKKYIEKLPHLMDEYHKWYGHIKQIFINMKNSIKDCDSLKGVESTYNESSLRALRELKEIFHYSEKPDILEYCYISGCIEDITLLADVICEKIQANNQKNIASMKQVVHDNIEKNDQLEKQMAYSDPTPINNTSAQINQETEFLQKEIALLKEKNHQQEFTILKHRHELSQERAFWKNDFEEKISKINKELQDKKFELQESNFKIESQKREFINKLREKDYELKEKDYERKLENEANARKIDYENLKNISELLVAKYKIDVLELRCELLQKENEEKAKIINNQINTVLIDHKDDNTEYPINHEEENDNSKPLGDVADTDV